MAWTLSIRSQTPGFQSGRPAESGGWAAIQPSPRGHSRGTGRILSAAQEAAIQRPRPAHHRWQSSRASHDGFLLVQPRCRGSAHREIARNLAARSQREARPHSLGAARRESPSNVSTNRAPWPCEPGWMAGTQPLKNAHVTREPRATGATGPRGSTPTCAAEAVHQRARRRLRKRRAAISYSMVEAPCQRSSIESARPKRAVHDLPARAGGLFDHAGGRVTVAIHCATLAVPTRGLLPAWK
jgi:hypothetical protein